MLLKRQPSTTSFSGDDDDDDQKLNVYDVSTTRATFAVAPANWSSPASPLAFQKSSPMSMIPPEILIHIIKHLQAPRDVYHTLQVSRTWCECSVEYLWHKPILNKLEPLLKLTRLLTSPKQTFTYSSFIRRLNFLSIGMDLKDEMFTILAKCDRLERLTLVGCNALSGPTLSKALPSFPSLVAVDLTGVENTTNDAIVGLARVAKRLQGINLGGCKLVSDEGVSALAANCPMLRRVKLSGLDRLTDEPVSALAKSCPLLLEIDLNGCKLITDISIRDIWTFSTQMREMKLSHCPELTDSAFPAPMTRRDKTSPSDPFPAPAHVDGDELPPLVIPRTFEHLRMLDLTACSQITDDAVEGIILHTAKIRNLVLNKCSLLTDRAIENICKLGRHLHYLHLGHTSNITDKSVRTLARSCTRLRYVDFANCTLLTDMAVFELASLPKLRRVGLVRVSNLTDEAIYALAERHATLERIHLSYCDQITVMAIHFLLQKLHKLTHLSLTGVPTFRQPELQQFCREPPSDFSTTQQSAFCVYSGKGVSQLRAFLTELFDRITEIDGTDDTEYEDDEFDAEAYHEDTPEPDIPGDDEEEFITRRIITPTATRDFVQPRSTLARRPLSADSGLIHSGVNQQSQSNHLSLPVNNSIIGPARRMIVGGPPTSGYRSLADALPVVETTNSPPPSDVASNLSGGTNRSNGAGFFRHYRENNSATNSGVMTPDLNFAEIGHGRGVQNQVTARRGQGQASSSTPRAPFVEPEHSSSTRPPSISEPEHVLLPSVQRSHPGNDLEWPSDDIASGSGDPKSWELQASVQSALGGTSADPRGRSVKRSLRNTLNAAEHYASSFLFGRSSTRVQQDDGAGPSSHPHAGNSRIH